MLIDPVIQISCVLILATVFLNAAYLKLNHQPWFKRQLISYALFPEMMIPIVAIIIPLVEMVIALLLLLPWSAAWGAIAVSIMMLIYISAIAISIIRGKRDIDCGCSGPSRMQPLRWSLISKNIFLITLAGFVTQTVTTRPLTYIDIYTSLITAIAVVFLYATADTLLANAAALNQSKES